MTETTKTRWWLCPNEPRCPHGSAVHDIYDDEDEVPTCCAEGCQCGHRPKAGPMTREEYAAFRAAGNPAPADPDETLEDDPECE